MSRAFGRDVLGGAGDFSISGGGGVFVANSGWVIGSGRAFFNASSAALLTVANTLVVGKKYLVQYEAVVGSGSFRCDAGVGGIGTPRTSDGTYSETLFCGINSTSQIRGLNYTAGSCDNWKEQEIIDYNKNSVALSKGLRV